MFVKIKIHPIFYICEICMIQIVALMCSPSETAHKRLGATSLMAETPLLSQCIFEKAYPGGFWEVP